MIHHETPAYADIASADEENILQYQLESIKTNMTQKVEAQVNGLRANGCMFDENEVRTLHQERYISQRELLADAARKRQEEFYGTRQKV